VAGRGTRHDVAVACPAAPLATLTGCTSGWATAHPNRAVCRNEHQPRGLRPRGKNGKDQRSFALARAFGRGKDFARPWCVSELRRTDANGRPESTSWGSLVRAQYRPSKVPADRDFSWLSRRRAACCGKDHPLPQVSLMGTVTASPLKAPRSSGAKRLEIGGFRRRRSRSVSRVAEERGDSSLSIWGSGMDREDERLVVARREPERLVRP
jgi:hypothetical protein